MEERKTRSSKKEEPQLVKKMPSVIPTRHIFFIDDKLHQSGQDILIEKFRHPGTDQPAYFIRAKVSKKIYEIHQYNEQNRSWFINESVSSNGKCNVIVPFDPMFFALYYFNKHCSDVAKPLEQLNDDEYPKTTELFEDLSDEAMLRIADRKGPVDLRAFRLNKEKALAWLVIKVELLVKTLKSKNIQVSENAISANYVKEEKDENFEDDYLRYASGIVGDYIPEEFRKELIEYLNIDETPNIGKRKSLSQTTGDVPSSKKIKVEANISVVSPEAIVKEKKVTAKEKALKKAASGTKSIASFFKK